MFVVCLLVMMLAMQYNLYWLMLLVGGVLLIVGKNMKTFIIVLAIMSLLYIIKGTQYEQYSIYVAAGGVVLYMILNKEGSQDSYNPNDQYADLLKGLGGGGGM